MINFQNKYGFTIMEVLLALVISCIVMVASVPIITVQKNYGHIEKWNRTQNNADIFYGTPKDSLKVGIGTTTPRARLHVRGYEDEPLKPVMTIRAGNNESLHSVNFIFADKGLNEIGRLGATTTDGDTIAIGIGAANNMGVNTHNPTRSVAIGVNAMRSMRNASNNVVIGKDSYIYAINSRGNIIVGNNIGNKTGAAYNSLPLVRNYIFSNHSLEHFDKNSFRNILIGSEAGANSYLISENICIGTNTCTSGSYSGNIIIGNNADYYDTFGPGRIVIGSYASNTLSQNYVSKPTFTEYNPPESADPESIFDNLGNLIETIPARDIYGELISLVSSSSGHIVGGVIDITLNKTTIKYADVEANEVHTTTTLKDYVMSDKRYKKIIGEYKKSIDDLEKIYIYRYKYKSEGADALESAGVIAQEIKSIFPDAVITKRNKDIYMVNYDYINMATLNAVKDLEKKNKELKQRVDKLKKIVAESQSCECP